MEVVPAQGQDSKDTGLDFVKRLIPLDGSPFLNSGLSLRALVELVQAQGRGDISHLHAMGSALERSLELQDNLPLSSSLFKGMPGIGWAMQLCPALLEKPATEQLLADLDELLLGGLLETPNPNLDLVNGLAGIMVYAMRRSTAERSGAELWSAIEQISVRSIRSWLEFRSADRLARDGTEFQRNLGLAHGVPGLLTMMVTAFRRHRVSSAVAETALEGLEMLWELRTDATGGALYQGKVGSGAPARLGWCYGALGVATAFSNASYLDGANSDRFISLTEGAIEQFLSAKHQIVDASLCHGAAGAHLYFHLFSRSQLLSCEIKQRCAQASQTAGADLGRFNVGEVGTPSYLWHSRGAMVEKNSFLEGTCGVQLAKFAVAGQPGTHPWLELLGAFPDQEGAILSKDGLTKEMEWFE